MALLLSPPFLSPQEYPGAPEAIMGVVWTWKKNQTSESFLHGKPEN